MNVSVCMCDWDVFDFLAFRDVMNVVLCCRVVGSRIEASQALDIASSGGGINLRPNGAGDVVEVFCDSIRGNPSGASSFVVSSASNDLSLEPGSGVVRTSAGSIVGSGSLSIVSGGGGGLSLSSGDGIVTIVGSELRSSAGALTLQSASGNDLELRASAGQVFCSFV